MTIPKPDYLQKIIIPNSAIILTLHHQLVESPPQPTNTLTAHLTMNEFSSRPVPGLLVLLQFGPELQSECEPLDNQG